MTFIKYRIGDTYHGEIKSNRSATLHDWEVFVDVTKGDVNLVRKVVFKIKCGNGKELMHTSLIPVQSGSNWRYQIRKQTEGPVRVDVKMVGYRHKDAVISRKCRVVLSRGKRWSRPYIFHTVGKPKVVPNAIPEYNFGIELELSTGTHHSVDNIVSILNSASSIGAIDLTHSVAEAKRRNDVWRITYDTSLSCPRGGEDCNKFELISPILKGGRGLTEVHKVLKALNTISSVEVGKSMGYHVHVDVSSLSCHELVKVCKNFIKYEKAMDSVMPPSRREDIQLYCKSNEKAINSVDPHGALAQCQSKVELAEVMNPAEPGRKRYFKLNLQNLVTGRQPTIEFRQHSGSSNISKIKNWIRFCTTFVHNSAKFQDPFPLRQKIDDDKLFEMLMVHVINDRYLRDYYRMRRNELHRDKHNGKEKGACCESCAARGQCAAKFLP